MITRPTVFILGAGASVPYGFPSGSQLCINVIRRLESTNYGGWYDIIRDMGFDAGHISDFVFALRNSGLASIDALLERRPEFMEIGKTTIALGLLLYEEEYRLNNPDNNEKHWYKYFYNKIVENVQTLEGILSNKISIITFNYDRSLDQYFFICLKSSYGKKDSECANILKNLPIIHVHGQLGDLPWQNENGRQYYPRETIEDVKKAVEKIIVLSEADKNSAEFERAFKSLLEAERIFFLGFGYLEQNLKRLKIDVVNKIGKASIYGTTLGIGKSDKKIILQRWNFQPPYFYDVPVHDFLMNHARWDQR